MLLRKDEANRLYYFPYGKFSSGYKLENDEAKLKVKNVLSAQSNFIIIAIVVPFAMKDSNLPGLKGMFALALLYFAVHFLTSDQATRKLKKSEIKWEKTFAYKEPPKVTTLKGLVFALIGTLICMSLAIYLFSVKSNMSPFIGWGVILFFSYLLLVLIKKIIKKEYEARKL